MAGKASPTTSKVTRDDLTYALNWGYEQSGGMTEAQKREMTAEIGASGVPIAAEKHVEFMEQMSLAAIKCGSIEKIDLATKKQLLEKFLGIPASPAVVRNFDHLVTTRLDKQLRVANKEAPKAAAEAEKKGKTLAPGEAQLAGIAQSIDVMKEKGDHHCALPGCIVTDLIARAVMKSSLKECSGCHQAWYCSTEHQKAHWKAKENGHKADCKKAQALLASQKA